MATAVRAGKNGWRGSVIAGTMIILLAGCEQMDGINPFNDAAGNTADATSDGKAAVTLVERDVEAPEVFQVTDMGLWDGRPSLGGVWVAHPEVDDPERVIIRNISNSKFVIGALFRRERENPGPPIQVSSDAASALGLLAGQPQQLNVTALRRESGGEQAEEDTTQTGAQGADDDKKLSAPTDVETDTLDPIAGAAAAIEEAQARDDAPVANQRPAQSDLEKPYIQIGIFSVEQNARDTATAMRQSGMVPSVKKQTSKGKTFWRVIVGPATSSSERSVLLDKIKGIGFEDAYAVTN